MKGMLNSTVPVRTRKGGDKESQRSEPDIGKEAQNPSANMGAMVGGGASGATSRLTFITRNSKEASKMRKTTKILFSLFSVLIFIAAASPSIAGQQHQYGVQAPQKIGDTIYGCYKKTNGQLRIVNGPEDCNPSELPVSWSHTGQAEGGDAFITYVTVCENTPNCVCDNASTEGMVLSGYAECPSGAVLASAGTPADAAAYDFQARCMYLDGGAYADPAYIAVRCLSLAVEANCGDGVDNDGDGTTDCDDGDCSDDPACVSVPAEVCNDGMDNDGDEAVDCTDTDCADDPACVSVPAEVCNDGMDNDGDEAVDCTDTDCTDDPACQATQFSIPAENCSDGIDNDGDGKIDCKDKDCKKKGGCK